MYSQNQLTENQDQVDSDINQNDMDDVPEAEKPKTLLEKYTELDNIAEELDKEDLAEIGMEVLKGVQEDKTTQKEWLQNEDDAQRLATLKKEPKNYPLPQSANIKFPLITDACAQFAARTYPEIIKDGMVVKGEVLVEDPTGFLTDISKAISIHMSSLLLGEDTTWEKNLDQLLIMYANIGCVFKKKFYDSNKDCIDEVLCDYRDLIIRNDKDVHNISDLYRITHVLHVTTNDLLEGARSGIYCEDSVEEIINRQTPDSSNLIDLYECHCLYDLDDDDYKEPYIVTCEALTGKVLRIVARFQAKDIKYNSKKKIKKIIACQYFIDFHFLPSPDGRFLSMGFGTLMLHLNETINTILNQLIDAGTLANLQFGFIDSRVKFMGGQQFQDPGMWNMVKGVSSASGQKLSDMFLPMNYKEPSQVLFQLLGLLIDTGQKLTASTDIMSGQQNSQNSPANTTAILAEQGMKLFSNIQRRLYRSLKEEFGLIKELLMRYSDPKETVLVGAQHMVPIKELYSIPKIKVIPVADPNLSSDAQRMSKMQPLLQLMQNPETAQYINGQETVTAIIEGLRLPNPKRFVKAPQAQQPDPKMVQVQMQHQVKTQAEQTKSRGMDLKEKEYTAKLAKMEADIEEKQAKSYNLVTSADKMKHDGNMDEAKLHVDVQKTQLEHTSKAHQQMMDAALKTKELQLNAQHQAVTHDQNQQQIDQAGQANDQTNGSNGVAQQPSNQSPPESP